MAGMSVHWKIERLDGNYDEEPRSGECMLKFEGRIQCDGQEAGLLDGFYIYSDIPDSPAAFMDLWDSDAESCAVYEKLFDHDRDRFRDPLPQFLEEASGILYIDYIALRPRFRGIGLGREVIRETVRSMADSRVGAVLLNGQPIQHRPYGYDYFNDEIRDLPWNPPQEDRRTVIRHLGTWGMRRLPQTRFMLAAPDTLSETTAAGWPPAPLSGE